MPTIRFHQTTTATPSSSSPDYDFGPGRSKLFKNSDDAYLKVHNLGPHRADVTEGSGGEAGQRLYYDWSDPQHVQLKTIDSNLFGGASGHTYTLTPRTAPPRSTSAPIRRARTSRDWW